MNSDVEEATEQDHQNIGELMDSVEGASNGDDIAVNMHSILDAVNKFPGSTAPEIAQILKQPNANATSMRMYSYATGNIRRLQRVRQDGNWRYYPVNFKLADKAIIERPSIPVLVDGEEIFLKRVTAEELKQIEIRKKRGKYGDIIDALDTLPVGDAIFVPREHVSDDGVRRTVSDWFKNIADPAKQFANHTDNEYLVFVRKS